MTHEELPNSEAYRRSCEELFGLISSPFERDFDAFGTSIGLSLPVRSDLVRSQGKSFDPIHELSGFYASGGNWNLELGYEPYSEELDIQSLTIPVRGTDANQSIQLKQLDERGFLLYHVAPDAVSRPTKILDKSNPETDKLLSCYLISSDTVHEFLNSAGYAVPRNQKNPDQYRLLLSELIDLSSTWTQTERIVFPTSDVTQIMFERTHSSERRQGTRRTSSSYITALRAISEDIDVQNSRRIQFEVKFDVNRYTVKRPLCTAKNIAIPKDQKGTLLDEVIGEVVLTERVKPTQELVDSICVALVDVLTPPSRPR